MGLLVNCNLYFLIVPLFLLILIIPFLSIVLWLFSELMLGDLQILGANPRTYIVFFMVAFLLLRNFLEGRSIRNYLLEFIGLIFFLLLLNILLINVINNNAVGEYLRFIITLTSNIFTVLLISFVVRDIECHKKAFVLLFIFISINAVIGILQFFNVGQVYLMREHLHKVQIIGQQGRVIGLSRDVIEFGYTLQLGLMLALGFINTRFPASHKNSLRIFCICILFILGVAMVLNGTRSVIGGVLLSVFFYALFGQKLSKEKLFSRRYIVKAVLFIVCVVAISKFILNISTGSNELIDRLFSLKDPSALGRSPRFMLALDIFKQNLFGVGSTVNYARKAMIHWGSIGPNIGLGLNSFSVHNHFLRAFVFYGFIGGILFLVFFLRILVACIKMWSIQGDYYLKGFFLGSCLFLVAYAVNIFFHNYGPLSGDNLFWFWLGLMVAAINIDREKNDQIYSQQRRY